MPWPYAATHLLSAALCGWAAFRLPARSIAGWVLGAVGLAITIVGLMAQHRTDWAWVLTRLQWPDLVFFTNFTLQGTTVLLVRMWVGARSRWDHTRAGILSAVAAGACAWSYCWYFSTIPSPLFGRADHNHYCPQTTPASCGAAAAVMLLSHEGIPTNEHDMAELCLTRRNIGTSPLGLMRGLAIMGAARKLQPRVVDVRHLRGLAALGRPAILSVGLRTGTPPRIAQRLYHEGWDPDVFHAVVLRRVSAEEGWVEVSDPSMGIERWPATHLDYLWDGQAIVLMPVGPQATAPRSTPARWKRPAAGQARGSIGHPP